jgi:hypothetical protein
MNDGSHVNGHAMHGNSLAAFSASIDVLSRREKECYGVLAASLRPLTDREVMAKLGFTDPNAVRPRLTGLVDDFWAEEAGSTRDEVTGKTVRLLRAVEPGRRIQKIKVLMAARECPQMEMAFA